MRYIDQIRQALAQLLVPYGGTISLPTGKENYPIALSNEIKGGHPTFNDLEDLAKHSHDKLQLNMLASVAQFTDVDGNIVKGTTYKLEVMPPQTIFDIPDYDLSAYWKVFKAEQDFVGAIETQYAPDYNNKRPLFQAPSISHERYQDGYASDTDDTIIWETEYDASKKHKWQRQRQGATSDWGIPVQIYGESYNKGDYIDNIFIWVLKDAPAPAKPLSSVNGKPNSTPTGWVDVPEPPTGVSYEDYVNGTNGQVAHDLYRTSGQKNAYQQLISEWEIPIKINTNPLLVRYGNQPTSTDYLNTELTDTWRGYYSPGTDTHMASRPDELTEWEITQIDNESGEYTEFVYKVFPATYVPTQADAPTDPQPFKQRHEDGRNAPNDWSDGPYEAEQGFVLYYSIAKKYNDGSLKKTWTKPKRADGLDTIQAVIEPQGKYIFKKTIVNGSLVIDPAQIVLKAVLYEGNEIITEDIVVRWYKGATQIVGTTLPAHTVAGDTLTILPAGVNELEVYRAEITYQNKTYSDPINILDVTDGQAFDVAIIANTGFTYKTEIEKTFAAQFYKNGEASNSGVTFAWNLLDSDGDSIDYTGASVTIPATAIDDYATLTVTATFGDTVRSRSESLTDVVDGKGYEFQFSRSTETVAANIVESTWKGAADAGWTNWPTGAIWERRRQEGATEWMAPIRIVGETGKPNGGTSRNVYKWSISKPSFNTGTGEHLSVAEGLIPDVAGWTDDPGDPPTADHSCWMSYAFFTIHPNAVVNTDGTISLTPANWSLNTRWSDPIKVSGKDGVGIGVPGEPGPAGKNGWTPVLANVTYGDRVVQRVIDWTGGTSAKPATGMYVSGSGFTTLINLATNIRGGQGPAGDVTQYRPMDVHASGSPNMPQANTVTRVSDGQITLRTITVTNNHSAQRTYKAEGYVSVRSDDGWEEYRLGISRGASAISNVSQKTPAGAPTTMYTGVTFILAAGSSIDIKLSLLHTDGGAGYRSDGYLLIYGL